MFAKNDLLRMMLASKAEQLLDGATVKDFSDKGAPEIKKYSGFGEEGYGFIHVTNQSKEATFTEKVNYKTFKGLQMIAP